MKTLFLSTVCALVVVLLAQDNWSYYGADATHGKETPF